MAQHDIRNPTVQSKSSDFATKRLIIDTALSHFARCGIEGATLSQIREAAGQNNRSAIHYHFGGKEELLRAAVNHIEFRLKPFVKHSLEQCKALEDQQNLTIEDVVKHLGEPFSSLFNHDINGRDCVLVLSHLTHDPNPERVTMVAEVLHELLTGMLDFLAVLMPEAQHQKHTRLLCLCLIQLIETLSTSPMLEQELFDIRPDRHAIGGDDIFKIATRFASGGLIAAANPSA